MMIIVQGLLSPLTVTQGYGTVGAGNFVITQGMLSRLIITQGYSAGTPGPAPTDVYPIILSFL